jgi:hypothetical protein
MPSNQKRQTRREGFNVKAQEVAQSVPRPFTGVVCPELPVGSPEREELFAKFRETFDEDWKAAEAAVERDRLIRKGDLYFIRCGDAVKIGRTTNIVQRLANMQVNNPHEIDCLLLLKGQGKEEEPLAQALQASSSPRRMVPLGAGLGSGRDG